MSDMNGTCLKWAQDAKTHLQSMSTGIETSAGAKNLSMAAVGLANEYLKKGLRLNS